MKVLMGNNMQNVFCDVSTCKKLHLCGGAVWFLWGKKVTTLQMNVPIWEGPSARLDLNALSLILEWRPRLLSKQNRRRLRNLLLRRAILRAPPPIPHIPFNLDDIPPQTALRWFRFEHANIRLLAANLLPEGLLHTPERDQFEAVEGLCLVLRILASPESLHHLVSTFSRAQGVLSRITKMVTSLLHGQVRRFLTHLDQAWLLENGEMLTEAAKNVAKIDAAVWGFVDGKTYFIGRVTRNLEAFFNGHKQNTCIKFETVVSVQGLAHRLSGPANGVDHDARVIVEHGLLRELALLDAAAQERNPEDNLGLNVIADSAYPQNEPGLLVCARDAQVANDDDLSRFRDHIAEARSEVEHFFALLTNQWRTLRCKEKMAIFQRPVIAFVSISIFLTNAVTCAQGGNQISDKFCCPPPCLAEYLAYCEERAERLNL